MGGARAARATLDRARLVGRDLPGSVRRAPPARPARLPHHRPAHRPLLRCSRDAPRLRAGGVAPMRAALSHAYAAERGRQPGRHRRLFAPRAHVATPATGPLRRRMPHAKRASHPLSHTLPYRYPRHPRAHTHTHTQTHIHIHIRSSDSDLLAPSLLRALATLDPHGRSSSC